MKTYLISQKQIKQFAVFLIVAMLAVFFAGYYLGGGLGGRLDGSLGSESLSATPVAIEPAEKLADEVNTGTSLDAQSGNANEGSNVKPEDAQKAQNAEATTKATSASNKKKAEQKAAEKSKAEKKLADKKRAERQKAEKAKAEKKKADKKRADAKQAAMNVQKERAQKETIQKEQSRKAAEKQAARNTGAGAQSEAGKAASSQAAGRYYSIQAGMFASKVNARSFIDKLAEKNFKAYVSNFVSTSGAVKYNVRVGRFEQREQARVLLRKFQQSFSSPAYVVISDEKAR